MTTDALRLSQVITTFGPGAMVDLPKHSVIIAGLDSWHMRAGSFQQIHEPRLTDRLQQEFWNNGRLTRGHALSLRTPPRKEDNGRGGEGRDNVDAFIFPEWFVCAEDPDSKDENSNRRQLVQWKQLTAHGKTGERYFKSDSGKRIAVTPIRFVAGCKKGHIQDIDWRQLLHTGTPCSQRMWIEERGTSAAPTDTVISCECGRPSITLDYAFARGRLGRCGGRRPWLRTYDNPNPHETCDELLRFLTRTATNTYFPQVISVISLPEGEDEIDRVLGQPNVAATLQNVETIEELKTLRKLVPHIKTAFDGWSDDEVFAALKRPRNDADGSGGFREPEFDLLASGREQIGSPEPGSKLFARTLPRREWVGEHENDRIGMVQKLVAVHRLREVMCLYGFTRFEAPPAPIDDGLDEVRLSVEGAPLGLETDWLPAVEQLGEGIFLQLDADEIMKWHGREGVLARHDGFLRGFRKWKEQTNPGYQGEFPGMPYVLAHSLAHALILEIALDCGYPASSLKERIYALRNRADQQAFNRLGVLIYTSSSGAQGTLGGIVSICDRLPTILDQALERLRVCSNDPICADHGPGGSEDDRRLLGAACHGCLLIAETSCENRNQFLDRATLVETLANSGCPAF